MRYFLRKRKMNDDIYLQIYYSFRERGKKYSTTKHFKSIGMLSKLIKEGIKDPINKYQNEVDKLNENEENLSFELNAQKLLRNPIKNYGFNLVKSIYDRLKVEETLKVLNMVNDVKFDIPYLLENLIYSRIIAPNSLLKCYEDIIPTLINRKNISLNQIYEGLSILGNRYTDIIDAFNTRFKKSFGLKVDKTYFDCTNLYFEIDEEDELRRKGPSKENRKSPLVGLALLLDSKSIPLSMIIYPGNESEKSKLKESISLVKEANKITGRTIHVADKGLNSIDNIVKSIKENDGYIYSQSLKKLNEQERNWALLEDDNINKFTIYKDNEGNPLYKFKSCVDEFIYLYKDESGIKRKIRIRQKRLVTYNYELAKKQKIEINKELDKVKSLCLSKAKRNEFGDLAKYLSIKSINDDGEYINSDLTVLINNEKVNEDLSLAGYNMIITSEVNMLNKEIYETYHNLWKIERTFRILKSELEARPIYVRKRESIQGHLLVCYLAIYLLRILQVEIFKNKYTSEELIKVVRECQCFDGRDKMYNLIKDRGFTYRFMKENKINITRLDLIEKDFELLKSFRPKATTK